jgi:CheY-like chemotaxis protein
MAKIYFVDDDVSSELLVDNLRQRGHEVNRVCSADEALHHASSLARSDLVVLDLIMPRPVETNPCLDGDRCAGMTVFRELRKCRADLPLLVFTANQDPAPLDIIRSDPHARHVSRWPAPSFQEFVNIIYGMIGIAAPPPPVARPFIVHGHDNKAKLELKNYLQNRLGLPEPIILHEAPNLGRTIIEKFEDLAVGASLAFVLLTPDDRVASASDSNAEKRRARQNVILELGFFLGLFGRETGRVFLLHRGGLDIPSDLGGVLYVDITNGIDAAGEEIRRELK